jgi:predicted DNA-binding transcriptional regulator AlpA
MRSLRPSGKRMTDVKNPKNAKPKQKAWLKQAALHTPLPTATPPAVELRGPRLLDKAEVCNIVGVTFATLWTWMQNGTFPRSRIAGGKSVWVSTEVEAWMRNLPIRRLKSDKANASATVS